MQLDLIPAHDGSKRMANNNAPFFAKRMIKDVLEAAFNLFNAGLFNLVYVDEHLIIPAGWLKL